MLFTFALVENNQTQCYFIVSDTKDRSKSSVAIFILKPLEIIKFQASKPKSIIRIAHQMSLETNLFVTFFFLLSETRKCFSCFEWEYSATYLGKGVVDGIGGTAKSRVYAEVKAKRATVQNAIDFATVAVKIVPNITVISVLQND